MKWILGIGGAVAGFVAAVALVLSLYVYAPGTPGRHELLVQVVIVSVISGVLGIIGFGIGCTVDLCTGMHRKMRDRRNTGDGHAR